MHRIRELINEIRIRHPDDNFFSDFKSSCEVNRLKQDSYLAYESALVKLDEASWIVLKEKSIQHFKNHRPGQLKTGFFAQLNEAFAYRFLVSHGYTDIKFVLEGQTKTPDITFKTQDEIGFCEVKSLGISDEEIKLRDSNECIDGSLYTNLSPEFIRKLEYTIQKAKNQIGSLSGESLVYIVIEFDDFTYEYLSEYRKQLQGFLSAHPSDNLILQIGLEIDTIHS